VARVESFDGDSRIKDFPVYCRGGWGLKGKGVEKVLYQLSRITPATDVFFVEGEKDVDTLGKMGLPGTTSLGGAGKFLAEYARFFNKGQHITILPDNDEPGRKHAEQVASILSGKVASIKILELPGLPVGGDVSDWAHDRDPQEAGEELCRFADGAPFCQEQQPDDLDLWHGQIYTLEEAFKPRQPIEYVVEGIVALPSLAICYGSPGCFKSLILADLAICVAAGLP